MAPPRNKKSSDYTERGFVGLHIQMGTRQRLNLAKSNLQARQQRFISQDAFINLLLDRFDPNKVMEVESQR
jgi:hypothetical protein